VQLSNDVQCDNYLLEKYIILYLIVCFKTLIFQNYLRFNLISRQNQGKVDSMSCKENGIQFRVWASFATNHVQSRPPRI